jgi:hypothetical protein
MNTYMRKWGKEKEKEKERKRGRKKMSFRFSSFFFQTPYPRSA